MTGQIDEVGAALQDMKLSFDEMGDGKFARCFEENGEKYVAGIDVVMIATKNNNKYASNVLSALREEEKQELSNHCKMHQFPGVCYSVILN